MMKLLQMAKGASAETVVAFGVPQKTKNYSEF